MKKYETVSDIWSLFFCFTSILVASLKVIQLSETIIVIQLSENRFNDFVKLSFSQVKLFRHV